MSWLSRFSLAQRALIGLISIIALAFGAIAMLIGIVVTNAIVLIDLINQYRRQGYGTVEAVIEGGRHRLRPILMTALATIFALLPMALGVTGRAASSPSRWPWSSSAA